MSPKFLMSIGKWVTLNLLGHLSDRTGVFVTSGLVARDGTEQCDVDWMHAMDVFARVPRWRVWSLMNSIQGAAARFPTV